MKTILGVRLYNQTEIAALLGVSTRTVYQYVQQGRLQGTTIGGKKYISEDELKRFIKVLPPIE